MIGDKGCMVKSIISCAQKQTMHEKSNYKRAISKTCVTYSNPDMLNVE